MVHSNEDILEELTSSKNIKEEEFLLASNYNVFISLLALDGYKNASITKVGTFTILRAIKLFYKAYVKEEIGLIPTMKDIEKVLMNNMRSEDFIRFRNNLKLIDLNNRIVTDAQKTQIKDVKERVDYSSLVAIDRKYFSRNPLNIPFFING